MRRGCVHVGSLRGALMPRPAHRSFPTPPQPRPDVRLHRRLPALSCAGGAEHVRQSGRRAGRWRCSRRCCSAHGFKGMRPEARVRFKVRAAAPLHPSPPHLCVSAMPPSFLLLSLLVNACHPVHRRVALFNDTSLRGRAKLLCAALFCASHFDCVARVSLAQRWIVVV